MTEKAYIILTVADTIGGREVFVTQRLDIRGQRMPLKEHLDAMTKEADAKLSEILENNNKSSRVGP